MATPISSHVKDKNSVFTARDEDMIFLLKGKIPVFHQYLDNKCKYLTKIVIKYLNIKYLHRIGDRQTK